MLDKAVLENLKIYNWGQDTKLLRPIDEAVIASHGDAAKRKELEGELAALLATDATLDGKQTVCRYLMAIGTAASVPALAALLSDEKLAHMGRYALERIPGPEAAAALRGALAKSAGKLKIGVISSLGGRKDNESAGALAELVGDGDVAIATSAVKSLGMIRSPEAAKAISAATPDAKVKPAATDAALACAEALLAAGKNTDALAIYKKVQADDQRKHVKLAATRGMLAASKKE
jgi:HEAT repeat protein